MRLRKAPTGTQAPRSQSAVAVAENIADVSRSGFCSPEMIHNAETNTGQRYGQSSMQSKPRLSSSASGRETESVQRARPHPDRSRIVLALSRFPSPLARELNTATTVQWPRHRPSSRDGRALAGVGANDGITHLIIVWDGRWVSGEGGRIFYASVGPARPRVATSGLWSRPIATMLHIRATRPVAPEHREHIRRHKAGIPQSSPAGTGRHSSWPFSPRHHRSEDGGIGELQLDRLRS